MDLIFLFESTDLCLYLPIRTLFLLGMTCKYLRCPGYKQRRNHRKSKNRYLRSGIEAIVDRMTFERMIYFKTALANGKYQTSDYYDNDYLRCYRQVMKERNHSARYGVLTVIAPRRSFNRFGINGIINKGYGILIWEVMVPKTPILMERSEQGYADDYYEIDSTDLLHIGSSMWIGERVQVRFGQDYFMGDQTKLCVLPETYRGSKRKFMLYSMDMHSSLALRRASNERKRIAYIEGDQIKLIDRDMSEISESRICRKVISFTKVRSFREDYHF